MFIKKSAIVDWFGYNLSPIKSMKFIKEAGFSGVMLLWTDQFDSDYLDFPDYAYKAGLYVENAHAPYEQADSLWVDSLDGEDYAASIEKCVKECSQREVSTIVMHPANGRLPLPENNIGIERLRRIVDCAEKFQVNIAMENMKSPEFLEYIYNNIVSERLGFCFDSGHCNLYSPNLDLLNMYGNKLMALHLHDNNSREDEHALPYAGDVDWDKIGRTLNAVDYQGAISLEVRNTGFEHIDDPAEFLKIAYEMANRIF